MIFKLIGQGKWHKWFAWYPVRVYGDKIIWLADVQRWHSRTATFPWQYKEIGDE